MAVFSCVSHSIDSCIVAIKSRNMHAVWTNQTADICHFNDNTDYLIKLQSEMYMIKEIIHCL